MLFSSVQKSDSVIHTHTHTHTHSFLCSFHYGLLQDIEYPVLYSKALLPTYFMYISLYLLVPNSQFIPLLLPFPFGNHIFFFNFSMSGNLFLFYK